MRRTALCLSFCLGLAALFLSACKEEKPNTKPLPQAHVEADSKVAMGDNQWGQVYRLQTGERVLVVTRWWDQGGSPRQTGVTISTTLLPALDPKVEGR